MNVKLFFFFFGVVFVSQCAVADLNKKSSDTIPFVLYKTRLVSQSIPATIPPSLSQTAINNFPGWLGSSKEFAASPITFSTVVEQEASTSNIPTTDVQKLILQVRNAVCDSVGDSDVRVWVSIDASGKLLGVGVATQSGLEVTFHCKGKPQNEKV